MEANLEAEEYQDDLPLLPSKHEEHNNSSKLKDGDSPHTPFPPEDTGGKRPYRDSICAFLFLGTVLTTYGIGIVAFTQADFNLDSKLELSKFNPNTNQCEILQQGRLEDTDHSSSAVLAAMVSLSALVVTFPVGVLLLCLVRRYTGGFLLVTAPVISLVLLGCSVCWVTVCYGVLFEACAAVKPVSTQIPLVVYPVVLSALFAHLLWKNWSRNTFEITVQVLKMATHALKENFWLLILNLVLLLGSMVLVNGPIFTFIWYALKIGKVAPYFDVVNDPSRDCDQATGFPCCHEEHPDWITAYVILACFTLFWVLMVTIHLQNLVVSGTVSRWYFAPTGSSSIGNIKHSLRNAFGPSFGTACNLGTIVTIVAVGLLGPLKRDVNKVLNNSRQGIISSILQGCFAWMFRLPECHPRFTSNFAAISGDSLWESSKKANNLLRRNALCRSGANFTLLAHLAHGGMIFVYALLQSFVVYGVLEYFSNAEFLTKFFIALFCFPVAMIGLGQFHQAISAVIDTVYICYAMEKDVGKISKPEVCHAFTLLPPSLPENGAKFAGSLAPEEQT